MLGQKNLISKLTSYTIYTFPQTILILGESGSGKHMLVREVISPHLKLDVIDITDNISNEYISEIQLRFAPSIYVINVSAISEKEQNMILKLIEEPLNNSYLILLSNSPQLVIPTVLNRCIVYNMENYTREEMFSFMDYKKESTKEFAINICTTPGQVSYTSEEQADELQELSKKIVEKIKTASFDNTLKISTKLNYKNDVNKFNIDVFLNSLTFTLFNEYKTNNNDFILKLYYKTIECKNKLINPRLNKEILIENYLTGIWKMSR